MYDEHDNNMCIMCAHNYREGPAKEQENFSNTNNNITITAVNCVSFENVVAEQF